MAQLSIFRLEPNAEPGDPRWDRAPSHGEVVVRARSAADARIVAAEAELDSADLHVKPGHGVSTDFASAFRDDKLYSVVEVDDGMYSRDGPRGVVSGLIGREPLEPGQSP